MNKTPFSRRDWINSAAALVLAAAGTQPAARAHAYKKAESSGSVDLRNPERQAGTECIREYIRDCRQAALAELKPSRRQIDRALALHEESIVCDPIGGHFEQADEHGLCSAAMGEVIRRKLKRYDQIGTEQYWDLLKEVAGQRRVFELVADPLMQRDQRALLQAGGVTMGTDTASPVWSQQRVALAGYMIDNLDYIEKVTRPGQVAGLKRKGRFGCLWISHGRFVLDADPIKALDLLYLHGVRQSLISTAVPEKDTGSAHGDPQQGLGDLGRTVLKRMNQLGMIVDASHTSPQTALDIAAVSGRAGIGQPHLLPERSPRLHTMAQHDGRGAQGHCRHRGRRRHRDCPHASWRGRRVHHCRWHGTHPSCGAAARSRSRRGEQRPGSLLVRLPTA